MVVECVQRYVLPNPFHPSGEFRIEVGTRATVLENSWRIRVGYFPFKPGEPNSSLDFDRHEFPLYWKVVQEDLPVDRQPCPMVITDPDAVKALVGRSNAHLKPIGFWASSENPRDDYYMEQGIALPWPGDFLDQGWAPAAERDMVLRYLLRAPPVAHYMGMAPCRMCSIGDLGCSDLSDGVYIWPEGFGHYVGTHSVRPPAEFVEHVRSHW